MILRSIILAITAIILGGFPAWAQNPTLTENINNTGIPRQAPALGLPSIYGLNPCATGSAVGVTTPLFGIGGAMSDIDRECETRNNAAVVITGLKDETLAREILCEIKDVRQAAIRVGKPCLQDQPVPKVASAAPVNPAEPLAAVPVAAAPLPIAAAPVAAAPVAVAKPVVASIRPGAPAFCYVTGLDVSLYPDCTEKFAPASPVGLNGPVRSVAKIAQGQPVTGGAAALGGGHATSTAQRPSLSPPRSSKCPHGPCGVNLAALMALEKSMLALIEDRRLALAEAANHRIEVTPAQAQTSVASVAASTSRGAVLASADRMDQ